MAIACGGAGAVTHLRESETSAALPPYSVVLGPDGVGNVCSSCILWLGDRECNSSECSGCHRVVSINGGREGNRCIRVWIVLSGSCTMAFA
jgi:hypothetical protein